MKMVGQDGYKVLASNLSDIRLHDGIILLGVVRMILIYIRLSGGKNHKREIKPV